MTANIFTSSIVKSAIPPQINTGNTAMVSSIIDVAGWRYLEYVISTGTIADADVTCTVLVEGGNAANLSDAVAIPDADLQGTETEASFRFDDDNEVRKIGVKNLVYRYYRITLTPANNTGNLPIAVSARLNGTTYEGVAQPQA
jgi:hypothetical protein